MVSDPKTYRDELIAAAVSGVRGSLRALRDAHPAEHLCAYALVTDDDLDGVGCVACTEEFLTATVPQYLEVLGPGWDQLRAVELLRFMPVDWEYDDGVHALDPASALLRAHHGPSHDPEAFGLHVDVSFRALVDSLLVARNEGLFANGVFISVLSSDPSEHLLDLEEQGVSSLNQADLYRRWKTQMR